MTARGYWCKTMFIVLERSRGCIMTLEGSVVHMQNRKPATSHILISTLFHKRNWDDSRMIRREWIIDIPPKIRWPQIIIRTMIITMITIVNNWFIRQLCVHRDMKHLGSLESTQEARVARGYTSSNSYASFVLSKLPACFISRWTHADVWTNCFITFSTRWKIFFSRDLFADVMSVHNRNMKHVLAIEFDCTNLLAML